MLFCWINIIVMVCVNVVGSKMFFLLIVKGKMLRLLYGFNIFVVIEYLNKLYKYDVLLFFRVYFGFFVRSNLCFCFILFYVCSMII